MRIGIELIEHFLPTDVQYDGMQILTMPHSEAGAKLRAEGLMTEYALKLDPGDYLFTGEVYCLADSASYSASVQFPAMLRYFGLCDGLLGEPLGGNISCFGNTKDSLLPLTEVVYRVPTARVDNMADGGAGDVLLPDVEINLIQYDLTNDNDPVLQYIYTQIIH